QNDEKQRNKRAGSTRSGVATPVEPSAGGDDCAGQHDRDGALFDECDLRETGGAGGHFEFCSRSANHAGSDVGAGGDGRGTSGGGFVWFVCGNVPWPVGGIRCPVYVLAVPGNCHCERSGGYRNLLQILVSEYVVVALDCRIL